MVTGLYSHQMRPQAWLMFMVTNSKNYTPYEKENRGRQTIKAQNCGMLFWEPKLKQVPHLCYIKIHVTTNPTKRTWVLSNLPTCVVKLLNILLQMKLLFVTWLPLPCHHLLKMMKKYLVQL